MSDFEIIDLPLAEIDISPSRTRDLSPEWADGLARVIAAQGLINPITVRRDGSGTRLVAGLHRVEAFRILGRETIPARLSHATSDDDALLEEVMENLGRHELNALDRCHHLYELKQVWERMYPQTAHGKASPKRQSLPLSSDGEEIFGFARSIADKISLSQRAIKLAVTIWTNLVPTARRRLAGTDLAKKQTELKALSELAATKQLKVLDLILDPEHPEIGNVAEALFHLENGVAPSDVERRVATAIRSFGSLEDSAFDAVLEAHEERVIASLKRRGRI